MQDAELAEQALVAVLALEPARVREVWGWLSPADFGVPPAALIFARLLELQTSGRCDPAGLPELLRSRGELRGDGYPMSLLLRWWDTAPAPGHVAAYGRLVVAGQVARQLTAAGVRLVQVAEGDRPARALSIVRVQRALLTAALRRLESLPGAEATRATAPAPAAVDARGAVAAATPEVEEAELVTVGATLLSPHAARLALWLTPSDFESAELGGVFATAVAMRADGRAVDRVTVNAELRARGRLVPVELLDRAEGAVPVAGAVAFYARRVLSASVQRQVRTAGFTLAELGKQRPGGTVAAVRAGIATLDGLAPLSGRFRLALASSATSAPVPFEQVIAPSAAVEPVRW